ncbi:toll/interleukin-1 receptor domain-containing adapter protein [Centroberyx gerrardi]
MHGWFHKLFLKSRVTPQHEQVTKTSATSPSSASASASFTSASSSSSSAPVKTPSAPTKPSQPQSALSSPVRWSRQYDVFVCHSSVHADTEEAIRLVSFLEASPRSLRCFLSPRDASPGGAIPTELCQAMQNSHCRALLITPNFLQDDWCIYMMHQTLAEGPMSHRMIPLIQNLSHSQYPQELKFYYYIDLSKYPDHGYNVVNRTVVTYLEDMVENEKTLDCNMDSSSNRFDEVDSSQENKLIPECDPSETSVSLELTENTDERFTDVC